MYIHQRSSWPQFTWDKEAVSTLLAAVKFQQGRLLGKMESLGLPFREQSVLNTLTSDIVKTSEIEGENLNKEQVRSSIARHLGIDIGGLAPVDRHIDGIVEMMLDATRHYSEPLNQERLFRWHAALFPTGLSGMMLVQTGMWRTDTGGPMQVVSGSYGREKIHFVAPKAKRLPKEMKSFLTWFEQREQIDPIVKAAIAHLWFVTIHPFDDGNGRIARAIADMMLTRSENQPDRFYSMSSQIRLERKAYYDKLERTQKGPLDITGWILWFLDCLSNAILNSEKLFKTVLNKAQFWKQHADTQFNERQTKMLNLLFDGFKGKLTSSKWAKMMKCSQDTAARDINDLTDKEVLAKSSEGGRSTNYLLRDFPINYLKSD